MVYFRILLTAILLFFLYSCNSGKTDEEMEELWSKAQTTGQIIQRSGTNMNSAINKEAALRDAETRLQTGGGLFGSEGLSVSGLINQNKNQNTSVANIGMTLNIYLWQGALDTISFMPLSSADSVGGTIITDWYSTDSNENERCKLNIFIMGSELKTQNLRVASLTQNLRVASFCQEYKNTKWVGIEVEKNNNVLLENAILNKAKKLKLQSN